MSTPRRIEVTCQCGCDEKFMARRYDVGRGYGKFKNHSHAANKQCADGKFGGHNAKPKEIERDPFISPGATTAPTSR